MRRSFLRAMQCASTLQDVSNHTWDVCFLGHVLALAWRAKRRAREPMTPFGWIDNPHLARRRRFAPYRSGSSFCTPYTPVPHKSLRHILEPDRRGHFTIHRSKFFTIWWFRALSPPITPKDKTWLGFGRTHWFRMAIHLCESGNVGMSFPNPHKPYN